MARSTNQDWYENTRQLIPSFQGFVVKGVSGIHIEDSDRYGLRSLNPFEPLLGTLSLETMTRHGAFLRR